MSIQSRSVRRVSVLAAIVALLLLPLTALAQPAPFETVAEGLNNPRGLAFAPNGQLYVAEAGTGNNDGAILGIDLKKSTEAVLIGGLPSYTAAMGDIVGVHDVSFQGRGNLLAPVGLGADPTTRAGGSKFGWLLKVPPSGKAQYRADVAGHEAVANPHPFSVDSNPYSVQALPDGNAIVADAGANALFHVNLETGAVSTLAMFPDRNVAFGSGSMPAQAVPNAVTLGPDGALYVGQLLGFPFTPGESKVFRVTMDGTVSDFATGFTSIIDVTFDRHGNLYVLEIAKNGLLAAFGSGDFTGALIRVAPNGARTEVASEGLFAPGGVAIGPDGAAYVTNYSIASGGGQVVRIPLP